MNQSNLKSIKLYFLTQSVKKLPWKAATELKSLHINTRVDAELTSIIFTTQVSSTITRLEFSWAEIDDEGLKMISNCIKLKTIILEFAIKRNRRLLDPRFNPKRISDIGMISLFKNCIELNHCHVSKLVDVTLDCYINFKLSSLSLTLSNRKGISMDNILVLLERFVNLEKLVLSGLETDDSIFSDRVVGEDQVMEIPRILKKLKTLVLKDVDFNRTDMGFVHYYVSIGMPSFVVDFMAKFKKEFRNVDLKILN